MNIITMRHCSSAKNSGIRAEEDMYYTLTGVETHPHDNKPYNKGSDIEEFHMSVKSSHATLVSGTLMNATTYSGQIEEYFANVASSQFAYVSNDYAYIMDATEFRDFLMLFSSFERDSSKNGGQMKIRIRAESKGMIAWLSSSCELS